MPLDAPAVNALELEKSVMTLFSKWLASYFDGNSHAVGGNLPKLFPTAALQFQQSALPQPLPGVGITVVWVAATQNKRWFETFSGARQEIAEAQASFFFMVRAAGPDHPTFGNAEAQCRTTADLLVGLLMNSKATKPLAQKGIHKLRPTGAQLLSEGKTQDKPDLNFHTRLVNCGALLRYIILST